MQLSAPELPCICDATGSGCVWLHVVCLLLMVRSHLYNVQLVRSPEEDDGQIIGFHFAQNGQFDMAGGWGGYRGDMRVVGRLKTGKKRQKGLKMILSRRRLFLKRRRGIRERSGRWLQHHGLGLGACKSRSGTQGTMNCYSGAVGMWMRTPTEGRFQDKHSWSLKCLQSVEVTRRISVVQRHFPATDEAERVLHT